MRSSLVSFVVFVFILNASCQNDTNYIPVAAYWNKGDSYDFKVTKVKQTWQDKRLTQNDSSQYIAHFMVKEADTSSYTIEWTFQNNLYGKLGLPQESLDKFNEYDTIRVIYKTDEFGAFIEIINWQEISRMINVLVEELLLVRSHHSNADLNELRKSLQPMISVYSSQRGIEQLVFNELQIIHYPFGKQYEKGKIYNYTEEIPIMVNSEPATANGITFIRSSSADSQRCELVQRMKILPDSAKKMLRHYYNSIGMRPEAIGSTVESSVVEVSSDNIFDYYYYPGIPVSVSISRSTRISVLEDKIRQRDITLIENIGYQTP